MKVELNITGSAQACNEWTFATATVNGKDFRIMLVRFEEPSHYGIRQGRISKLWMNNVDCSEFINYDRGWDMRPVSAEAKAVLAAIIKKFN